MKIKSTLTSIIAIVLFMLATTLQPLTSAARNTTTNPEDEGKKPAAKAKAYAPRNNQAVKIYPDALKRVMHVVAKDNDGKEIDFFVFDLQGTLVQHFKMQEGDHKKLSGLQRGKYLYHVFAGDEETVSGQFEIR